MASEQIDLVAYAGIPVAPHRHVELAFGIHPPEAVEAGLVEVDEARGNLDAIIELVLAANPVVVVFRVVSGVRYQPRDQGFGIALDDLVSIDEIKVDIT